MYFLSDGGPQLSRQNKIHLQQNKINSRHNKENELVSGWSAVGRRLVSGWSAIGQRLLLASQMVCRVTVTHRSLKKPPFFELTMFCSAHGSEVDEDANFCKSCGKGTFLNLNCSCLNFFLFQITIGVRRHCHGLAD